MNEVRLTKFSHGAGCGCKISPSVLRKIIGKNDLPNIDGKLLVGNETSDDAAVYDLGNGQAIISTTDFFMPIVDDPSDFGAIASANALSDVYAMGGTPLMAIAILGWPINKLGPEIANEVLNGSRKVCRQAGITLAGGHSIDSPEPIFGLAVTGNLKISNLKRNSTAKKGSHLFLTKPLGIGIITTAEKKGIASEAHLNLARESMITLNSIGSFLGSKSYVNAMTDVTGFGLLGHLLEICKASDLSAIVEFENVPKFDFLEAYIKQGSIPGGTERNFVSYGDNIGEMSDLQKSILADPQTSGGLLVSVDNNAIEEFEQEMSDMNYSMKPIGRLVGSREKSIIIN